MKEIRRIHDMQSSTRTRARYTQQQRFKVASLETCGVTTDAVFARTVISETRQSAHCLTPPTVVIFPIHDRCLAGISASSCHNCDGSQHTQDMVRYPRHLLPKDRAGMPLTACYLEENLARVEIGG